MNVYCIDIELYLISVSDVWIWKLSGHQFIQNDAIGINVGLETVRIVVLHSDHLRSLARKITVGKRPHCYYIMSTVSFILSSWEHHLHPKLSLFYSWMKLTIHNMDPEGCSTWWEPLHLAFTVAKPKSPIFTVRPSCRKMSAFWLKQLFLQEN